MDLRTRVTILSESADRDGPAGAVMRPGDPVGITRVRHPGHGATRLMRIMQTNACSLSCGYCPTFCGGKVRRTFLAPEEVARVFMDARRGGLADGLFLTSGVPGRAAKMTDRMLAAVDLLRRREKFDGYIHLKLLPGTEPDQVDAAVRLANRVSVNLEAPADTYVRALAREKDLSGDLLPNLERAGRLMRERRLRGDPADVASVGTTTQFVVGAGGERDREILGLVARLEGGRLLHDGRPNARRRARSNRDPWIGRSASSGRGRRAGGLVPHASRPAACERAGAAPAPALPARSAPDSGALPDAGAAVRLPMTAATMIGYAAGAGRCARGIWPRDIV